MHTSVSPVLDYLKQISNIIHIIHKYSSNHFKKIDFKKHIIVLYPTPNLCYDLCKKISLKINSLSGHLCSDSPNYLIYLLTVHFFLNFSIVY